MVARKSPALLSQKGFSLVELLVVISVIGIIASIAIPNISTVSQQAYFAKNERNAQNLASLAAAARAAGATNEWQTVDSLVNDLENGISAVVAGNPVEFQLNGLSPDDRDGITNYLLVNTNEAMVYYVGPSVN